VTLEAPRGTRRIESRLPLDLDLTLDLFVRGPFDPCTRRVARETWWRALRTPLGPATLLLARDGPNVLASAWGEGSEWALEVAPDLVGANDDLHGFEPSGVVRDYHRRFPGLRIPRARRVVQCLLLPVLEQRVTGHEAKQNYHALLRRLGEPAPGPEPLLLPPDPKRMAKLAGFELRELGIEASRGDVLVEAARRARRLEELPALPLADAQRRLLAIRGIGPWTMAEVARLALGDADSVSVGDYNLPRLVSYNLLGHAEDGDDLLLELLAPFSGHRGRVCLLVGLGGRSVPRRGPRRGAGPLGRERASAFPRRSKPAS